MTAMIQAQLRNPLSYRSTPTSAEHNAPRFRLRPRHIAMLAVGLIFILVKASEALSSSFLAHPQVMQALLCSAAARLTARGALGVLFARRISERTQDIMLG